PHPPTTDIYTLSLPDALPISGRCPLPCSCVLPRALRRLHAPSRRDFDERRPQQPVVERVALLHLLEDHVRLEPRDIEHLDRLVQDRKSTRLNSSHVSISYAVF